MSLPSLQGDVTYQSGPASPFGGLPKFLQQLSAHPVRGALMKRALATDGQIEALVYELYRLTEEGIRVVERRKCDG